MFQSYCLSADATSESHATLSSIWPMSFPYAHEPCPFPAPGHRARPGRSPAFPGQGPAGLASRLSVLQSPSLGGGADSGEKGRRALWSRLAGRASKRRTERAVALQRDLRGSSGTPGTRCRRAPAPWGLLPPPSCQSVVAWRKMAITSTRGGTWIGGWACAASWKAPCGAACRYLEV